MTDVEQLLRDTLADPRHRLEPGPGIYESVRERRHQRRRRSFRIASAFTVVVLIAGVAIGIDSSHRRSGQVATAPSITPSTTPSPPTGQATPVDLGVGSTTSFALAPSGIFVARTQPNELVEVSSADLSVIKRIATPDTVDGIAVDASTGLIWTWSSVPPTAYVSVAPGVSVQSSTSIHGYTTSTLGLEALAAVRADVFSAVAMGGVLWLATSEGLYSVLPPNSVTRMASGPVFSVAADAVRHRILYGAPVNTPATANSLGSIAVHEIDANTDAEIGVGNPLPIGKESIAIVGDQIWVGGYGSGSTPRVFHLDGASLQTLQTKGFGAGDALELGPGAIVWPGASVLWVRSGGSEGLACVDPQSGAVLEQWDAVQGPVFSVRGHAFAASDGSLEQLSLTGDCTG
jgi:hypothetical protein